jgi:hypothetical protein
VKEPAVRVPGPLLADAPPRLAPRILSRPASAAVLAISTSARQRALRDACTEPMGRRPVHACFPPPIARRDERVRCLAPLASATLPCARRRASQSPVRSLARSPAASAPPLCKAARNLALVSSRRVSPRQQSGRSCPGPSSQADRTTQLGQLQSRLPAARVDGSAAAALQLALLPARCGLASKSQYRRHQLRCALYRPQRCRHGTALRCTALRAAQPRCARDGLAGLIFVAHRSWPWRHNDTRRTPVQPCPCAERRSAKQSNHHCCLRHDWPAAMLLHY